MHSDLTAYIRTTPRPNVSSTAPPGVYKIYRTLHLSIFLLILPSVLLFNSLKRIFIAPRLPWMSYKTEMIVVALKTYLSLQRYMPAVDPAAWKVARGLPGWQKDRKDVDCQKIVFEPVGENYRVGIGKVETIKAVKTPGWMLTPPGSEGKGLEKAKDGEKIVFYIPGGAYILGHPLGAGFSWKTSKALNMRVLCVNYRKTLDAASAQPAPLLDVLSAYLYLLNDLSFPSSAIIIQSESAGSHLALLLSRYLNALSLPQPSTLLLNSPWCDFSFSPKFTSSARNNKYDCLSRLGGIGVGGGMRWYDEEMIGSVWFSPALGRGEDWVYLKEEGVKVYVMRGTRELLYDEAGGLVKGMQEGGVDVTLRDDIDGLHAGPVLNFKGSGSWRVWVEDVRQVLKRE